MKKLITFAVFILLLAACSGQTGTGNDENVNEEPDPEQAEDETIEPEELEEVEETPTTIESTEAETEGEKETGNEKSESTNQKQSENQSNSTPKNDKKKEETDDPQHLVDLAYQIFDAQKDHDYDFLQSIISKGTKMDKKNNTFYFENVTYPHEQDFLTAEDIGEIEFRFTHENSKDSVTVGFGLINYEEEMSFVVEFEFVRENGSWKMNDMDLNK